MSRIIIIHTFFVNEMKNNSNLYVDKLTNEVDLTKLAESYLIEHPEIEINSDDEVKIFELVIDWFEQWDEKLKYNNY